MEKEYIIWESKIGFRFEFSVIFRSGE